MTPTIPFKVWVIAFILTCALVWAGHSATPPPIPKAKHRSGEVARGAGALKLIAKLPPLRPKVVIATRKLAWDWTPTPDNPASNVVFCVRSGATILPDRHAYPVVGVTSSLSWPFTVDPAKAGAFFVVTASNIVTGKESQ